MTKVKPSLADLTPDQLQALLSFVKGHGKDWKEKLLSGWIRAAYPGPLQQIRNTLGPHWLEGLHLIEVGCLECPWTDVVGAEAPSNCPLCHGTVLPVHR